MTAPSPTATSRRRIGAILAASSGNLVEWYDFYVYSFCALYFAAAFFPAGDQTAQLLKAAGIFAAGFLMRPLGGWFFGRLADRRGRRTSMVTSVTLMCAGSALIACLPAHRTLGAAAPALLLFARLLQGFSVGGEYGASATYMSEVAVAGRRGFYASFQYVTLVGGQLGAALVLLVLQQTLDEAALRAWGWRVPFAIGAALGLVALYLRRALPETATHGAHAHRHAGTLLLLRRQGRACAIVFGITAGGSLAFYTYTTYMQKYLVNTAGMAATQANAVMTAALFVFMLLQPAFGALSDRIGRRRCVMIFGGLFALSSFPLLTALGRASRPDDAFCLLLVALATVSFYTSVSGLLKAELFPAEVRALGVGLPYAVANALFGGSAEYVALRCKAAGHESLFFWYAAALSLVAFLAAAAMPTDDRHGHLGEDDHPLT